MSLCRATPVALIPCPKMPAVPIPGCYADSATRVFTDMKVVNTATLTRELCASMCLAKQYKYAALEAGSECYCSNAFAYFPSASSQCTSPCPGNSTQNCGGPWALSVFDPVSGVGNPPNRLVRQQL